MLYFYNIRKIESYGYTFRNTCIHSVPFASLLEMIISEFTLVCNFVSVEAVRTSYRITSQMSQTSDQLSDILRRCSKGSWEAKQADDLSVEHI